VRSSTAGSTGTSLTASTDASADDACRRSRILVRWTATGRDLDWSLSKIALHRKGCAPITPDATDVMGELRRQDDEISRVKGETEVCL
jgi:hypothetical protein